MRIVIAGGSGLIGHALSSKLILNEHEVTILSRKPEKVCGIPDGIRIVQWNGETLGDWVGEISNCEVVINLAGENLSGSGYFPSRWTKERKEKILQSRLCSGDILTTAILKMDPKPKIFVQASGIGIYGTNRESEFSEESFLGHDFLANLSKEWEASSKTIEELGVRRLVIRTGVVLSRNGGALRSLVFPYKFYIGGPIGDGQQVYSWIHIDDEVEAIRFLIEQENAQGVYNLTSPNPVTNADFGKTISSVMKKPHYLPIPRFMMQFAFGEVASMVLEGQRVIPKRLIEAGFTFKYPLLLQALEDLLNE